MAITIEELDDRIGKLEKDRHNRIRFFVQYLLSPLLVVAVGLIFNWQLEKGKKGMQQLQIAQSMLATLFSEDEFKALATKRLMDEVLESDDLKNEIGAIVTDYLNSKFNQSYEKGDIDSAQKIFEAAQTIGGDVGKKIVDGIEANSEKIEVLSKYQEARAYELDGFRALTRNDHRLALKSFEKAKVLYPDLHSVSEIHALLKSNEPGLDSNATRSKINKKIVGQYTWKVPPDIVNNLKEKTLTRQGN